MEFKLSIIIPCYNEADNIALICSELNLILAKHPYVEMILVNNGSTDNSKNVFNEVLSNNLFANNYKIVDVPVNKGYGFGILSGLSQATADVLAWTHADMQTDPIDIITAYKEYLKYNDNTVFVKGNRQQRALGPAFFTWGMGVIASLALKQNLTDIGAQPKLFSRNFYITYLKDKAPYDFSLDLYAQYWAKKEGKIIEIPVIFKTRLHGEAKGGGSLKTRLKVSKRVFNFIFEMRKNLKSKNLLN